jgi:hypothetical protein
MPQISNAKLIFLAIFFYLFILFPLSLNAQIIITEIMYNPESTDSGREWIEVYNSGDSSIDLSTYKLFENEVNHKISGHNEGQTILEPQKYAIIADNSIKFLEDYSQNGLILDSAFSLRNDGEEVSIVDPDENKISTVNYATDWGANGTGNSLQITEFRANSTGNDWIPADPTPFLANKTEAENENSGDDTDSGDGSGSTGGSNNSDSDSTHSAINDLSDYKPKIDFKISAGRERHVTVNTPIEFELIHNQDLNKGISASWSMGDGNLIRGRGIDYVYSSVGTYNVVVNAKFEDENVTARTKIHVSEPKIELNYQKSGKTVDVMLKNTTNKEINLGEYQIKYGPKNFKIAKDTIISPNSILILDSKITRFEINLESLLNKDEIELKYPNRETLTKKTVEIDPEKDLDLILSLIE